MLGFRSLLRTHDAPDLIDVSQAQLAAWLKHKRYDFARRLGPEPVEIGPDVWASVQHHTGEAGSATMRARVVEMPVAGAAIANIRGRWVGGGSRRSASSVRW